MKAPRRMSNREVAKAWATQAQPEGRNNNGQFYFNGRTLYSYGPHFIVAELWEDRKGAWVNPARYSPTTSKHQGLARNALAQAGVYGREVRP